MVVNEFLRDRFSILNRPSVIYRNIPTLSWYDKAPETDILKDIEVPVVVYIGHLSKEKGLLRMMQAKELLDKQGVASCFAIVGKVKGVDTTELARRGFVLTGWVDFPLLPNVLKRSSIGLALIQPAMVNYLIAQPSKVFAYMIAGLPIVATNLPGMKFIQDESCGILTKPDDPIEIASAISTLLRDEKLRKSMGLRGRLAVEGRYNAEEQDRNLLDFYRDLFVTSGHSARIEGSVLSSSSLALAVPH